MDMYKKNQNSGQYCFVVRALFSKKYMTEGISAGTGAQSRWFYVSRISSSPMVLETFAFAVSDRFLLLSFTFSHSLSLSLFHSLSLSLFLVVFLYFYIRTYHAFTYDISYSVELHIHMSGERMYKWSCSTSETTVFFCQKVSVKYFRILHVLALCE